MRHTDKEKRHYWWKKYLWISQQFTTYFKCRRLPKYLNWTKGLLGSYRQCFKENYELKKKMLRSWVAAQNDMLNAHLLRLLWWIEVWFSFSWCCWGCRYSSWYLRELFIAHWLVGSFQLFPYTLLAVLFSHQTPESNQDNVIPFTHMASWWAPCGLYLFLPSSSLNRFVGCGGISKLFGIQWCMV